MKDPGDMQQARLPWFREPWPWILMAGPAVVVVAAAVTLWLAIKSSDGLVTDDYYKQGIEINKTVARDELAAMLELGARLRFEAGLALTLTAREGVTLPGEVRVSFIHPTRDGLDRTLALQGSGGEYRGPLPDLAPGQWQLLIEDPARAWRLTGQARLPDEGDVRLGTAREVR